MVPKAILLDFDNTLYDYEVCNRAGMTAVFSELAKRYNKSESEIKNVYASSRDATKLDTKGTASSHSRYLYIQKTIEQLSGKTDIDLTFRVHEMFWESYIAEMVLFNGVEEFFQLLKQKGILLALVTDLTLDVQMKKIMHLNMGDKIDFLITSEEAGHDKPHPRIYSLALEKLNLRKEDVLMIGDSPNKDIKGAEDAGIRAILADSSFFTERRFKDFL